MIDTKKLSSTINLELKPHGFIKKGSTWYLQRDDVIAVFNLQKSSYSNAFFINLGFWLQQIEEAQYPKPEQCHISNRVSSIWPNENPRITDLLNIDDFSYDEDERIAAIKLFISENIVPTLLEGTTIPGLLSLLKKYDDFLIMVVAQKFLDLEMS